ncbi:Retrovirus-related Pol polyprotein from transposon TNT 1-94 [Sesbania bispinosa]|nr:Retrovirus-related Pol polyprotein from transposon TNT 1-94 [Sesbania bispinosa]
MENFLRSKEYWQVIEYGVPKVSVVLTDAQQKELEAMKLKDLKAKNYLFQAIDRSVLDTILNKEPSKDIWESMKKKYQGSASKEAATPSSTCRI